MLIGRERPIRTVCCKLDRETSGSSTDNANAVPIPQDIAFDSVVERQRGSAYSHPPSRISVSEGPSTYLHLEDTGPASASPLKLRPSLFHVHQAFVVKASRYRYRNAFDSDPSIGILSPSDED